MAHQQGSAFKGIMLSLGLASIIFLIAAVSYVSAFNTANRFENRLQAQLENNRNILSQYSQKLAEAAQVPDMMRDDLAKLTQDALQGRYGKDGSRAVLQMISEQNPQVSHEVYLKLQQIIEAGRDEFKGGQTTLIDTRRAYETALGSFWQGLWMRIAGYPKRDLSRFQAISLDAVETSFDRGKESGPLVVRPPKR